MNLILLVVLLGWALVNWTVEPLIGAGVFFVATLIWALFWAKASRRLTRWLEVPDPERAPTRTRRVWGLYSCLWAVGVATGVGLYFHGLQSGFDHEVLFVTAAMLLIQPLIGFKEHMRQPIWDVWAQLGLVHHQRGEERSGRLALFVAAVLLGVDIDEAYEAGLSGDEDTAAGGAAFIDSVIAVMNAVADEQDDESADDEDAEGITDDVHPARGGVDYSEWVFLGLGLAVVFAITWLLEWLVSCAGFEV